jgi:micrococcal nuclease
MFGSWPTFIWRRVATYARRVTRPQAAFHTSQGIRRRRWVQVAGALVTVWGIVGGTVACGTPGTGQAVTPPAMNGADSRSVTTKGAVNGTHGSSTAAVHTTTHPATVSGVHAQATANSSAASSSKGDAPSNLIPVTVVKDVDGDTIDVRMPDGTVQTVRMLLIDTPETVDPRKPVEPYGPEASTFCKKELPAGKHIYIEEGVEKWDKYHRLLAYVWVTKTDLYNEDVVRAGLARVAYVSPPNTKYLARLEADQTYAKAHHLGIWTIPGYVTDEGYNLAVVRKSGPVSASKSVSASTSQSSAAKSGSKVSSISSGNTLVVVSSHLTVARRHQASVTIRTKPGATGTIEVDYKSGPSHAKGLGPKQADSRGYITWTWTVGSNTTPGKWPVRISAAGRSITLYLTVY